MEDNFQYKTIEQKPTTPIIQEEEKKSFFNKKNLPKISAIVIVFGIIIVVAAIFWGRSSFSTSKLELKITAPDEISSGEETILSITYQNNNRVALNDAHLTLNYPQGVFSIEGKQVFQDTRSLGTIGKKSGGKEEFEVRIVGEKGEAKNITARLDYKPQNINSHFENSNSLRVEINKILISFNIEGSGKAVAGQSVSYLIEYENKTSEDISNLEINLEYPEDFQFKSAEPTPKSANENNIWEIALLKANEKKSISLIGVLSGQEMENKIIKGSIGKLENENFLQYGKAEFITQISPAPIVLDIKVNELSADCKINSGQGLRYKISFRNNTDVALRELILKAYLKSSVFDVKEIDLNNKGFFDSRNNVIIWSGAEIGELNLLEPNQSGEVGFSIPVKESLPIYTFNDKNFKADIIAEIQTPTVPAKFAGTELKFEKELSCKINSRLTLNTKAYYYELSLGLHNTGPLPPKVDNMTTYTLHWLITNTANDLDNVQIKTTLPQGITWTNYQINKFNKGQIYYNERTKEVVWDIGRVTAGIGITMSAYELIFQIGLTPSINQIGQLPILINESIISGKDLFTEINLNNSTSSIDTSLPDDNKVGYNEGRVRE